MDKELRSIVVTSSVQSEGNTNTAINLAYTIAQSGSRVLLIDADLRRPRLTGLFSLKKNKGLTDIISTTFNDRISKGKLEDYSIGDLLLLIKLQKRTGELHIDSNENQIAIYFSSGKVVDVYWKNRPESKKLANTLIRKELLTEEEASVALDHQKKSIQRLGTILFSMGLVSKEKLSKELIGSNGTEFLMKLLRKKFDFIILDTPLVLPATDAILMAPRTDGTLLVIKSGNTERKIIKDAMENFKNANFPILGTILNFVDLKREGYYRYYKKYYSSYYGD